MDLVIGLPRTSSRKNSIWVIVDRLTKSTHFLPIANTNSMDKPSQIYVKKIVWLHWVPKSIVSDKDMRFTSCFWKSLQKMLGTSLRFSSVVCRWYTIQTLEDMLWACVLEVCGDWENHLLLIEFTYNNSFQAIIQMTPYEAPYGRKYRSLLYLDEVR